MQFDWVTIDMFYQIKSYLKFLSRSSNQHGVHSPFVYNLITKCFYDRTNFEAYKTLQQHRSNLLKDPSSIEVTDFGAGSRVFKSNTRAVAAIAKNAGISKKRQRLLVRIVRYLGSSEILEFGTSLGMATAALSLGNPSAQIQTVEGCSNTALKAKDAWRKFQLKNIQLHQKKFEEFLDTANTKNYDLVFIDGNHNKDRTLFYFESLLEKVNNDSVFIFDDIYWSSEMTAAWQEIIAHPQVTVSIDTFQWGLVFFRKEQPKQHFSIRL